MDVCGDAQAALFKPLAVFQPAEHTEKSLWQPDCGSPGGWADVCQPSIHLHIPLSSDGEIIDETELRGGMYGGY